MSQEAEVRRKFEEWALRQGLSELPMGYMEGSNKYFPINVQIAWLAWQEQEKRIGVVSGVLKIMNATCTIANEVLEAQIPKITAMQELIAEQRVRIAFLQKQADRLDGLRLLCEDSKDGRYAAITIGRDTTAHTWYIDRAMKRAVYGDNFNSAIDAAIAKETTHE